MSYHPRLDEHGFPIPPTFDDDVPRRPRGSFLTATVRSLLVLAFIGLLAGWAWKSDLASDVRRLMARRLISNAAHKYRNLGDAPGALADLDRAAIWAPNEAVIYGFRAEVRFTQGDITGCLSDLNQTIRLSPRYSRAYLLRSQVYQRLDRHRDAIDDLTKAIHLSPSRDTLTRNNRAYARAVANVEIDEALVDVQQALDFIEQDLAEAQRGFNQAETADLTEQKATYLDTRGYIYFRQGKQEAALADLNQAIELTNTYYEQKLAMEQPARRPALQKQYDQVFAVMYHHRGLVYEKLGRPSEAKSDLDHGDSLGYNPAAGVF
ncbi:MAG TPA: hypothetical protein VF278_00310 [Pirellulales bacterium]